MKLLIHCLLVLFCTTLAAQPNNQSSLTIDQIMQGEDFVGYLPTRIDWSNDSKSIYFSWNPDNDTIRSTYAADITTKQIKKLSFDELKERTRFGEVNKTKTKRVYAKNGDIFLEDYSNEQILQITNTSSSESAPRFSADNKFIIYKSGSDIYTWSIDNGSITQLTNFKKGKKKKKKEKSNSKDKWLKEDQYALIEILRDRKNQKDASEHRSEQTKHNKRNPIYYGDMSLGGSIISPDLKFVSYNLYKSVDAKRTLVPNFVSESGYTEDLPSRSKVGGEQAQYESWIYDVMKDTSYQIEIKDIAGIYDKPTYMKEYHTTDTIPYKATYDAPRDVYYSSPIFSEDGKAVMNITSQDHKDRWIMLVDLPTGKLKLLDRQHDDAWIGGPQVGWFSRGVIEWLDNDNIWFKSEKTGYAHVYKTNVNTGTTKALTSGNWEVINASLSNDKSKFYLTTNETTPHEQHFYHMPATGGEMTRITNEAGGHQVTISPDEKHLAIRYSYTNKPWELYLMKNEAGAEMHKLTESTNPAFDSYSWIDSEIIRFKAKDGTMVPATLYQPEANKKNGAAVIFVHGAGYLQNVHRWWPSYFREYMFHNFLVDNGYTVLAIDFRASAGYGRDWRTAIYRHMGGKDLDDQIDGAAYLVSQHGIDKNSIGIYGGSYGGFITLMALFNSPDTFKSGAALRSVTDWAHYNHGYTSPILNTPTEDDKAYKRSSPIYFAEGLKGNLLMLHGMIDRNVQFQDVVRLSQRLIELKKENWELSVFPVEGHGFKEASSWSDEYRRIYKLFSETLLD